MRGHAHCDVVASRRPISDERAIHLFITRRAGRARLFLSTRFTLVGLTAARTGTTRLRTAIRNDPN